MHENTWGRVMFRRLDFRRFDGPIIGGGEGIYNEGGGIYSGCWVTYLGDIYSRGVLTGFSGMFFDYNDVNFIACLSLLK